MRADPVFPDLDFSVDAMEAPPERPAPEPAADPWLERRSHSFGASETAALLISLGLRHPEDFPRWVQDLAKPIRVAGLKERPPRLFAAKAGLAARPKVGRAAHVGTAREAELFEQAVMHVGRGTLRGGGELLDASTLRHAVSVPRQWLPLVDRHSARLSATPDAWGSDVLGRHVTVELKCSVKPYGELPEHYRLQVQAQIAVMGADAGVLVVGQGWAADFRQDGGGGPVVAWDIDRDDEVIRVLRDAARRGWEEVERLRAAAEEER